MIVGYFPSRNPFGYPIPCLPKFSMQASTFFSVPLMMVFTGFLSLGAWGFHCMHPYRHSFGLPSSSSLVKMPSLCQALCYLMDNINIISTSNGIYIQMRKEKKSY